MATAIIGTLKHLPKASILPTLPETGRPNRIYFIPNEDPTEDNRYNEYLWVKDETYPDGHWELVGPTTIDLTDYATKEEVSDLKDSIGEQIKKYLPLSGGTMDKGSNISFPLDSGSTVYNGSGISVGGKASTDILHAAGGTTKIKTLNGESMLGEGNIVIDPSSVPVSLSWYNRTSSQQDATINLTIGDTTVNLFPNIFKLFKAGKVSTSESLSIELTANPGVSGVPQVPTSLCQWSIPLADSNTAGIISSEDKAKLDNLSDPKNLLAYGVEWDSTNSSPVLTRIGNMSLHKSLPIQSALRGCVCQGKRIMYYLDPNDWSKKADGTDSRLDGYDGTVQVEVPEFYLWSETEGTKSKVYVSTQKVVPYAIRIPHMLVDAYRSTVLNEVPKDMGYLSTLQVNSAISVVNTSSYCRGGNNSSSSDTYLESDKFRTNLGKPRTNTSRANFRTYAKNAGKMLLTYEYYKSIFYWLYVIEYANFNSQANYVEDLTEDGYRQGGLGNGVTTWSDTVWNTYNGKCPITPCGYCNEFGNFTGIKDLVIPASDGISTVTFKVPRWRGFDNVFGDIWINLDGILIDTPVGASESTPNYVYIINDPDKFTDTLSDAPTNADRVVVPGHTGGYITKWALGEYADIIPVSVGGSATTYMCDHYWVDYDNTQSTLLVGGRADHGSAAGLADFHPANSSGYVFANVSFRCLTLIS